MTQVPSQAKEDSRQPFLPLALLELMEENSTGLQHLQCSELPQLVKLVMPYFD
jgi:hypothetical protein